MTETALTRSALAAIPFHMHDSGWFLIGLCFLLGLEMGGLTLAVPISVVLLASLFAHEAGHILAATLLHVPVREFGLKLGGAYTRRAYATRRRDEILIAVTGPVANLAVALPLLFVPQFGAQVALCNLMLCGINLLPMPASDGMRILHNLRTAGAPRPSVKLAPQDLPANPTLGPGRIAALSALRARFLPIFKNS